MPMSDSHRAFMKIDPQPLGDAEDPLPVRHILWHIGKQPFTVFDDSFLVE